MRLPPTISTGAVVVAVLFLAAAPRSEAAQGTVFHALPEERTAVAVHVPSAATALAELEQRTRLGTLGSRERILSLLNAMRTFAEQTYPEVDIHRLLAIAEEREGLTFESLFDIFDGPAGYARIIEPLDDEGGTVAIDVFWFEPGGELAAKCWSLWQTAWEMEDERRGAFQRDQTHEPREQVRRIDSQVRGVPVSHIRTREIGRIVPPDFWHEPRDFWEWDHERRREFEREREQRYHALPQVERGQQNTMLARIGGAFVVARAGHSVPEPSRWDRHRHMHFDIDPETGRMVERRADPEPQEAPEPPTERELERLSGVEPLTALMARFADAAGGPLEDGFGRRALASPAGRQAEQPGTLLLEAYADLALLLKQAAASREDADDPFRSGPFDLPPAGMHEQLGLSDLGLAGLRLSLDGDTLRAAAFADAPAPRRGVLKLLEQAALPPQPAAWVPATAPIYAHFSLDVPRAYQVARELAIATEGPDFEAVIDQEEAEMKEQIGFNQRDLAAAMGTRHHLVIWSIDPPEEAPRWGDMGARLGLVQSVVFGVERPEPFERMFEFITEMMQQFDPEHPGLAREQGFVGIREGSEDRPSGTFIGEGHLVVAAGRDAVETTLSAIRRRDAGDAALRASDEVLAALRRIDARPAAGTAIVKVSPLLGDLRKRLLEMVEDAMPEFEGMTPADRRYRERLLELIPEQAVFDDAIGTAAAQLHIEPQGVILRAVVPMAPAE